MPQMLIRVKFYEDDTKLLKIGYYLTNILFASTFNLDVHILSDIQIKYNFKLLCIYYIINQFNNLLFKFNF